MLLPLFFINVVIIAVTLTLRLVLLLLLVLIQPIIFRSLLLLQFKARHISKFSDPEKVLFSNELQFHLPLSHEHLHQFEGESSQNIKGKNSSEYAQFDELKELLVIGQRFRSSSPLEQGTGTTPPKRVSVVSSVEKMEPIPENQQLDTVYHLKDQTDGPRHEAWTTDQIQGDTSDTIQSKDFPAFRGNDSLADIQEDSSEATEAYFHELSKDVSPNTLTDVSPETLTDVSPEVLKEVIDEDQKNVNTDVLEEVSSKVFTATNTNNCQGIKFDTLKDVRSETLEILTPDVLKDVSPDDFRDVSPDVHNSPSSFVISKADKDVSQASDASTAPVNNVTPRFPKYVSTEAPEGDSVETLNDVKPKFPKDAALAPFDTFTPEVNAQPETVKDVSHETFNYVCPQSLKEEQTEAYDASPKPVHSDSAHNKNDSPLETRTKKEEIPVIFFADRRSIESGSKSSLENDKEDDKFVVLPKPICNEENVEVSGKLLRYRGMQDIRAMDGNNVAVEDSNISTILTPGVSDNVFIEEQVEEQSEMMQEDEAVDICKNDKKPSTMEDQSMPGSDVADYVSEEKLVDNRALKDSANEGIQDEEKIKKNFANDLENEAKLESETKENSVFETEIADRKLSDRSSEGAEDDVACTFTEETTIDVDVAKMEDKNKLGTLTKKAGDNETSIVDEDTAIEPRGDTVYPKNEDISSNSEPVSPIIEGKWNFFVVMLLKS